MNQNNCIKTKPYRTMNATGYAEMMASNARQEQCLGFQRISYPHTMLKVLAPSTCPCCKKVLSNNITPIFSVNNCDTDEKIDKCETISAYRCTSCNHLFAIWCEHLLSTSQNDNCDDDILKDIECRFISEYPFDTNTTHFSDEINELSSDFIEIYNQAELAEHQNLHRICGMGYRKALEYLVDAYIKHKENTDVISERDLSKKIQNHITNDAMKTLAERATWLGNDATHIEIKHPDRDVTNMKEFIMQMVKWIDYELSVEDADSIERK